MVGFPMCTPMDKNRSRLLPKFIQNRIDEIRMSKFSYRYVPSRSNPADIATKGYMSPNQLAKFEQWWTGPQWLKDEESAWPQWESNTYCEHEEYENKICTATAAAKLITIRSFRLIDATRISKWTRLQRTTAWALRFITYISKGRFVWLKEVPEKPELTSYELAEATKALIIQAQSEGINEKEVNKWNLYYSNTHSLWKCRSRLDNISMGIYRGSLNLIYLPRHNPMTKLIIQHQHEDLYHAGIAHILPELRRNFWISKGRTDGVRSILEVMEKRISK
uniref:Integrase_H2C2 domain-containing protein n=1 Tax=Loa loa TaxID=7209 RepID=A0A1I7V918_LOALO